MERKLPLRNLPLWIGCFVFSCIPALAPARDRAKTTDSKVTLREGALATKNLRSLSSNKVYSLALSVKSPMSLGRARVSVTLRDPRSLIAAKTVHTGDPDLYLVFQPTTEGPVELQLKQEGAAASPVEAEIRWIEWS